MTDPLEPDLLRVLHQLPEQLGTDWQVEVIPGGMTNRNYRVRTTAADLVVRLSVPDTGQLGIDRDNEHHNSMIAARAGVGAPVIARVRVPEALVVGFVEGRTLSPSDFTTLVASPGWPMCCGGSMRLSRSPPTSTWSRCSSATTRS